MGYLISVDGKSAPTHEHPAFSVAVAEANRLASLPENKHAQIRILKQVAKLVPQTSHLYCEEHEGNDCEEDTRG